MMKGIFESGRNDVVGDIICTDIIQYDEASFQDAYPRLVENYEACTVRPEPKWQCGPPWATSGEPDGGLAF